jgi:formate hydrogenlyase transcriptional activator
MGRNIESIPTYALEALTNYNWPGNIRELQNVIERSVVLSSGPELHAALPEVIGRSAPVALHGRASNVTELSERTRILQVLKETKGMVGGPDGAAARLGLKRTTLQSRMRKYNIARRFQ